MERRPTHINTLNTKNPVAIRAIREAFEAAVCALGCGCAARPATLPRDVQTRLAQRIVECAREGERDVTRLRDAALATLSYREQGSHRSSATPLSPHLAARNLQRYTPSALRRSA